jgi:pSer/pThr/pTyr-binding forkhead associated (FHA) protein
MLKIRFKNNKYNAVWLVEPKVTIGRLTTNDLVVDDPDVADTHLEVLVDHENLTLKNLVPERPVKLNDELVTSLCTLKPEDIITIGNVDLQVIDPKREPKTVIEENNNHTQVRAAKTTGWALKANHTALGNRVFPLAENNIIGRSSDCDISLSAAHLSRRHARLQVLDGLLFVKDLGSANGTFLNGKPVGGEVRVKRGDELRFDALSFGVIGPADDLAKTTVRSPSGKPAIPVVIKEDVKPAPRVGQAAPLANNPPFPKNPKLKQPRQVDPPVHYGRHSMAILIVLVIIVLVALYLKG